MKMSRQGPGAPWKLNSWSTTAVAMVDTHSIAHCAALQAKGIKTLSLLLGCASSLLLQWQFFLSIAIAPGIRGKKVLKQTWARRWRCCEGAGCDVSVLGTTAVSGRFLAFPEAFLFYLLISCYLARCYGTPRWTVQSSVLLTESRISTISSALIQYENSDE